MDKKNKNKKAGSAGMNDKMLDAYLDAYHVPSFDEDAFQTRLMKEIGDSESVSDKSTSFLVWRRPFQALMAVVVAIFAVALYMQPQTQTLPNSDAGQAVMAGTAMDVNQPEAQEDIVLASYDASAPLADDFLAEMADQEILMSVYIPSNQAIPPAIDDFFDEVLGPQSR